MKKAVAVICIFMLIFTLSVQALAAGNVPIQLNLNNAMESAVSGNFSLQLLNDKILVAERKYNSALSNAENIVGKYWDTSEEHIENAKIQFLLPLQKLAELNELKWKKQDSEKALKLEVKKLYYQVLFLQSKLKNQTEVITRAKNDLDAKNIQVKMGIASASDTLSLEITVDEEELAAVNIQREIDKLVMELNTKLGYEINQKLNLVTQVLPDIQFNITDFDKTVASVIASAHSVLKLEEDKMLNDKERELTIGYAVGETPDIVEALGESSNNLKYSIRDEKVAVEYKVRSGYNNLLNLKDDVEIRKLDYDTAEKLLTVALNKYKAGLITNLSYQKSVGDRDGAQLAYEQAKLDYYIAVENFKLYIGYSEV